MRYLDEKNFLPLCTAALLLTIPVAGCVPAPSVQPGPEQPVQPGPEQPIDDPYADLGDVLSYFRQLRELSAAELHREQGAAKQTFAQAPSERHRVRLALAISLPSRSIKEDQFALVLLQSMTKNAPAPLRDFATLLHAYIAERAKAVGSAHLLQDQLDTTRRNAQVLQDKFDALKAHAQTLEEKLDALRLLEKSLSERERGAAGVTK
jgi:hypothetical protein